MFKAKLMTFSVVLKSPTSCINWKLAHREPTAWRIGHAIRLMMDPARSVSGLLQGVVELDETYVGGTPQPKSGVVDKCGKGITKQ